MPKRKPKPKRVDGCFVVNRFGCLRNTNPVNSQFADLLVSASDANYPDDAPHRAVHLREVRDRKGG